MIVHRDLIRRDNSRESARWLSLDDVMPTLGAHLLHDGILYELLVINDVRVLDVADRSESQYYRLEWFEVDGE